MRVLAPVELRRRRAGAQPSPTEHTKTPSASASGISAGAGGARLPASGAWASRGAWPKGFFFLTISAIRKGMSERVMSGSAARPRWLRAFAFAALTLVGVTSGLACDACKTSSVQAPKAGDASKPTVRLYLVSDVAGALEPCGCVKDQLGGLDHAAAWITSQKGDAPATALLSAGPLFFMDPELKGEKAAQDRIKAETLAAALKGLGFLAFAPGKNELAGGAETLGKLAPASGAAMLAANVEGLPGAQKSVIREVGGIKIGLVGVSSLEGVKEPALGVSPAEEAVKREVAALKQKGAQVFVALAATGRGAAKRLADVVPELTLILVGSPGGAGEVNTEAPPVERIGNVLVVETGNHLQTVAVVDLHVRDGSFAFADGTGVERAKKRAELGRRVDELRAKIASWEVDPRIAKADIEARKQDVAKLEAERDQLDKEPLPDKGSFFRYSMQEVRDKLGSDPAVKAQLATYYKQVNDGNKSAFASRTPKPPAAGEPGYSGIDTCSTCHDDARAVWDKTAHSHAYKTLETTFKEFNLDCVSCHVTGYDKPGGSTVTHVAELKDVQCEVCHGPGSLHVKAPKKVKVPNPKPDGSVCVGCHHPPHVHEFDAKTKVELILGPGHGKPKG